MAFNLNFGTSKFNVELTHHDACIGIKKDFGLWNDVLADRVRIELFDHLSNGIQCGALEERESLLVVIKTVVGSREYRYYRYNHINYNPTLT